MKTARGGCPSGLIGQTFARWDINSLESLAGTSVVVPTGDGLSVLLRRFRKSAASRASVLLVHGASAGSRTFFVPRGGLLRYLVDRDFDVWTLDWRASNLFSDFHVERDAPGALHKQEAAHWSQFNLDAAAENDLVTAVSQVGLWLRQEAQSSEPPVVRIVGHCVGGALVMQALATGLLTTPGLPFRLGPVVLSTLALFYRVGLEGWLKGYEFVLEELTTALDSFEQPQRPVINPVLDPGKTWPALLEASFQSWRTTIFAPNGWGRTTSSSQSEDDFLERIAFMYGMPFHTKRISRELNDPQELKKQFGDMPLGIYMHCVRNLRLGYAAPFLPGARRSHYVSPEFLLPEGSPVVPLTLLTGAQNQVWHRDSIDRTYEWLINQTKPCARQFLRKRVLTDYAHQDLMWSDQSPHEVYPEIERGLLIAAKPD